MLNLKTRIPLMRGRASCRLGGRSISSRGIIAGARDDDILWEQQGAFCSTREKPGRVFRAYFRALRPEETISTRTRPAHPEMDTNGDKPPPEQGDSSLGGGLSLPDDARFE